MGKPMEKITQARRGNRQHRHGSPQNGREQIDLELNPIPVVVEPMETDANVGCFELFKSILGLGKCFPDQETKDDEDQKKKEEDKKDDPKHSKTRNDNDHD